METIRIATARFPRRININWSNLPRPRGAMEWLSLAVALIIVAGAAVGTGLGAAVPGLNTFVTPEPSQGLVAPSTNEPAMSGETGNAMGVGSTSIAISANGGTAIADSSGGDANLAFSGGPESGGGGAQNIRAGQPAPTLDRKVVRNANMAVVVEEVDPALASIRQTAVAVGGVVFSSGSSYQGEFKYGQIVIHVPSAQFEIALDQLRATPGLVRVTSEAIGSQDVTQEYVDVDSRLRNLKTTEQELLVLMGKTANVSEVIKVFNQVASVRGEIEKLTGCQNFLTNQTDYSTITLTLTPKSLAPTPAGSGLQQAVREAWQGSLTFISKAVFGIVRVIVFLWWVAPLGLISALVVRRLRGRRHSPAPSAPANA